MVGLDDPRRRSGLTTFNFPAIQETTNIYRDSASDTETQVYFEAILADLRSDVLIPRLDVRFADAQGGTRDGALMMDGQKVEVAGELGVGKIHRRPWNPPTLSRSVAEVAAGGNRLVTWLVRETGLRWQVRNASAITRDGWLEIGKLRNTFSPRQEIVIAPLGENRPCTCTSCGRSTARGFRRRARRPRGER